MKTKYKKSMKDKLSQDKAKRRQFLAFRYGTWQCELCNFVNLNIDTHVKSGDHTQELVYICSECGQGNDNSY